MHKMLKKMSEKLRAKFSATTPSYNMVKIGRLNDAFREIFNCKQAQQKVNHCCKKKRKGDKGKGKKIQKSESLKTQVTFSSQNFDFCGCPSQSVINCDSTGKKGQLSCCKCIFHQIKANLAKIKPQNHQNVQKTHFWQKAPGVNG